jgi:hypothetical protein
MKTPYQTPETNPEILVGFNDRAEHRNMAVVGTVLLAGPLFGAMVTIINMIGAFSKLAKNDGNADASALAGDISSALIATLVGGAVGLVGVGLVSLVLFRGFNRERWFFRSVVILAILWCLLIFPFGLIVGVYLLIVFLSRRGEFSPGRQKYAEQISAPDR